MVMREVLLDAECESVYLQYCIVESNELHAQQGWRLAVNLWCRDEAITTCIALYCVSRSLLLLTGLQAPHGAGRDPVEEAWCVEAQHPLYGTISGSLCLHQSRFSNDCRTWHWIGVVH
ncbi:Uncharacterized protein HZ326_15178 [Fusarium oxysporum f. sp. albedinis]|nr:Uncharacterized protein HZ326_15178 [Fusarium oxysporum f. sp. albedinis]